MLTLPVLDLVDFYYAAGVLVGALVSIWAADHVLAFFIERTGWTGFR